MKSKYKNYVEIIRSEDSTSEQKILAKKALYEYLTMFNNNLNSNQECFLEIYIERDLETDPDYPLSWKELIILIKEGIIKYDLHAL